jgi:hypothetical protein
VHAAQKLRRRARRSSDDRALGKFTPFDGRDLQVSIAALQPLSRFRAQQVESAHAFVLVP